MFNSNKLQTLRTNNQSRAVIARITYRPPVYIAHWISKSDSVWPRANYFVPFPCQTFTLGIHLNFPVTGGLGIRASLCVIYLCYYEPGMARLKQFIRCPTRICRSGPVHFLLQSLFRINRQFAPFLFIISETCSVTTRILSIGASVVWQ